MLGGGGSLTKLLIREVTCMVLNSTGKCGAAIFVNGLFHVWCVEISWEVFSPWFDVIHFTFVFRLLFG